MRKLLIFVFTFVFTFSLNSYSDIKVGIILGFTGPIESLTPAMAGSAELAFNEANSSGLLLEGKNVSVIRADSTCEDPSAAVAAAKGVISLGVVAMIGADCPGISQAILEDVTKPNGILMISPAATDASLTYLKDNDYFFRTTPSNLRSIEVLADITKDRKIKSVAVTFLNTKYGKKLEEIYRKKLEAYKIKVTTSIPHEDGKDDYSSEVAALASAGGDAITVIGYINQGGKNIIQTSLDSGAFDRFILSEGMIDQSLVKSFGKSLKKSFGLVPGSTGKGFGIFFELANANGIDASSPYTGESYDAAALIILAMQAAGSTDKASIAKNIMAVANKPGTKIYPGELKKGLDLLAKGKKINYEGVTELEFSKIGEPLGTFLEKEFRGGKLKTKKQR